MGEVGVHTSDKDKTLQKDEEKLSCLQKVSYKVTGTLETCFERLGLSIGTHPWRYILGCIITCVLCGFGLISFSEASDPDKLWVPEDSQVVIDKNWIDAYYPANIEREQIIGVKGNILTPTGVRALLDLYQDSFNLTSSSGITFDEICVKSGSDCMVLSILEFWSYDNSTIRSLSQADIVTAVNSVSTSPMYGNTIDITDYIGGITTDANGDIIAAEAAAMTWLANSGSPTTEWETELIQLGRTGHSDLSTTYVFATRSRKDETGSSIQNDVRLLTIGYIIVVFFVVIVLGKFNFLEQRAWLTLGGFVCIGLAILVSIGVSSAIQQEYGPIQSILPFLLLGIGVDDMFVIMGSLNNLPPLEQQYDIPHKMADVLRHAGVSITVTSVTDFIAFFIGATTVIPALRSFCIYAGIGIIALYLLQAIFFTSCLTIDLQRLQANRDGCCCMINHGPNYSPNECSQKQLVPFVFKRLLAKLITKLPFKVVIVTCALAIFGSNVYGLIELRQYFDPNKYLPSDSYAYKYAIASEKYFPQDGALGYVYCGNINYWSNQTRLEDLNTAMTSSQYIANGTTDSWFEELTAWLETTTNSSITALLDSNKYPLTESDFIYLTNVLTTDQVPRTSSYIRFGSNDTDITATRFPFRHVSMDDAQSQITAMDKTRDLVKAVGFSSSQCFPFSSWYRSWETNKIIREELYRNLGIAIGCVFFVTLLLIADLKTSLIVFCGVVFTLVDVAGTMHFWGLTIETVTSIVLILSIGLAVDYSAHIGHMFMTIKGSRDARTKETVGEMGPPVFYGGFSTFLAFSLLSTSNSYVFQTFFKVNFLVVLYGLFHGLIFLPVVLSWFGPSPYPTADRTYIHHHSQHQHNIEDGKAGGKEDSGIENPFFETTVPQPDSTTSHKEGQTSLPPLRHLPPVGLYTRKQSRSILVTPDGQSTPTDSQVKDSPPPSYSSASHITNSLPTVQS